jgi:long-chain fatty acid transport protein
MKHYAALGSLVASAGMASAGAIDRGTQSTAVLFERGSYVELNFGHLSPDVQGTEVPALGGQSSGDMYRDYNTGSLAIKTEIREGLDAAFIIDRPYGAGTAYPWGTGYIAQGTTANLDSTAYTALLKCRFPSNVSLLGGIRYQTLSADAFIPFVTAVPGRTTPYSVNGAQDGAFGYVLGIAWEKPEIMARVSLTYNSAIDYGLATTETSFNPQNPLTSRTVESTTDTKTPQSVNLEFQSGVAPNTLVYGSIRWVDWTEFNVAPPVYQGLTGKPLVFYNSDVTTYTIGAGYRFNDTWSAAVTYAHDTPIGGYSLNLGPVDGYNSIGLAATYTREAMKITAGRRYLDLGDTQTEIGRFQPAANFDGNSAWAFGLRLGYYF